jgi:hypothetical protein
MDGAAESAADCACENKVSKDNITVKDKRFKDNLFIN